MKGERYRGRDPGSSRSITLEDGGLDGGTVDDGLVRVDQLVGLLSIEEVGDELDDSGIRVEPPTRTISRTWFLSTLASTRALANGVEDSVEEVLTKLLEARTGEGGVEVDSLFEGVDLNGGLVGKGEGTLGTLASNAETTKYESPAVASTVKTRRRIEGPPRSKMRMLHSPRGFLSRP